MKKKLLVFILVVLMLSMCLTFVGCNDALPIDSWMSYINDDALLKNIVIPGSHDTGTYDLNMVAKTQDKDMAGQLACGTRYFDLRFDVVDGVLVMYHGAHGPLYSYKFMYDDNALTVITQIRDFLQTHTTEMLILDITNIFDEAKPLLFSTICQHLKDFAIVNDSQMTDLDFIDSLQLKDCRGKCLILWGAETDSYLDENFIFKRNDDTATRSNCVLHSFYTKKYNSTYPSQKYISTALPIYIDMYREVGAGLFVLQGQLTDGLGIYGPRSKEDSHFELMNEYVGSLADSDDLKDINIIMRDFVGYCKNAYAIKLNLSKGYVKAEFAEDFKKMANYNIKLADENTSN